VKLFRAYQITLCPKPFNAFFHNLWNYIWHMETCKWLLKLLHTLSACNATIAQTRHSAPNMNTHKHMATTFTESLPNGSGVLVTATEPSGSTSSLA
jgi:hypothetical protein